MTKNATTSAPMLASTNRAKASSGAAPSAGGQSWTAGSRTRWSSTASQGIAAPVAVRRNAVATTTVDAAAVGSAMRTANPPKVRPVDENTIKLVRFDTGRKPDDAFAS